VMAFAARDAHKPHSKEIPEFNRVLSGEQNMKKPPAR